MIKLGLKKDGESIFESNKLLYILSNSFDNRIKYSLNIVKKYKYNKILIITEKNKLRDAVSHVLKLKLNKQIIVVNFESLNKVIDVDLKSFDILKTETDLKKYATNIKDSKVKPAIINGNFTKPDVIIVDSAHRLGVYPAPNKAAQNLRKLSKGIPILACGFKISPTGKNVQLYHQLYAFNRTKINGFYGFAKKYILVKNINLRYSIVKSYDTLNALGTKWYDNIIKDIVVNIDNEKRTHNDIIHTIPLSEKIKKIIDDLRNTNTLKFKDKIYSAFELETKQKYIHQLLSGTIKLNDKRYIIDYYKANFLKQKYGNNKILIVCRFIAEQEMLNDMFKGNDNIDIIGYITNLPNKKYDYIIFYSITTNVIKYQNIISKYDSIRKVHIFAINDIETDIYTKLKMQINSL